MHKALLVLTLALPHVLLGGVIRENSFAGHSDDSRIYLRWLSDDEAGVVRYELERKSGLNQQFFLIAEIATKGNNSTYEYTDESAFRTSESIFQYRIKVVLNNGTPVYYGPITVSHHVSSVRRTWGSIKAMFR
jgi:hypothetical protein